MHALMRLAARLDLVPQLQAALERAAIYQQVVEVDGYRGYIAWPGQPGQTGS
jgi:hypothetical protein